MLLFCFDTNNSLVLLVSRSRNAVIPAWSFLYFVFSFSCWRTSCWYWSIRFACLVYFNNADIFDAPSAEAIGITGAVPGSVGATNVWLLLTLFFSVLDSTVTMRPSAYPFAGMFIAHFWRYL